MNSHASLHFGLHMSEQKDVHTFPPVPMVYESFPAEPLRWEYHVLTIDPREQELPTTPELNELGNSGWLLVSVVKPGEREPIRYYFVRQVKD